jgi:hypothetical protein
MKVEEKNDTVESLRAELVGAKRDASNWRAVRDLVHRLDAEARPGAKMADDDVLDVVSRVLNRAVRPNKVQAENAHLRERLREVAQVLIAEVGAEGPMDAEDAARKAVARMERLRELADQSAHEAGLYARRMGEAQARARKSTPQDEELALLRSELQEQARLVGMGSEREARLMAQLEEARRELQGVMEALPVTTIAFTGDYGLYVRNCMSYLLLQELQKRGQE